MLLGEYDNSGNFIREYVYANGEPLAQIDAGSPESVLYLHTDHLLTARYASDAGGNTVWTWDSGAFGAEAPTGSATVNLRFPGQYYDTETGLHYNWHRYYDPATGRYITSDPLGLAAGLNTYGYAAQNPLSFHDPDGRLAFLPPLGWLAGGAILGGILWAIDAWDIANIWGDVFCVAASNAPAGVKLAAFGSGVARTGATLANPIPNRVAQEAVEQVSRGARWVKEAIEQAGRKADDANLPKPSAPDPRVQSDPARGRFDNSHTGPRGFDKATEAARENAGDLGLNPRTQIDPETGTIIGQTSEDGLRGWRVDNDHVNWWDWTQGKRGKGGRSGHEFFPPEQAGPHSKWKGYGDWWE